MENKTEVVTCPTCGFPLFHAIGNRIQVKMRNWTCFDGEIKPEGVAVTTCRRCDIHGQKPIGFDTSTREVSYVNR